MSRIPSHFLGLTLLLLAFPLHAGEPVASVDFDTEVIPVLTRAGCNGGACHGGAAGRGGFKLSLWGSNPASDYDAIVRELEGRRIDRSDPGASLFVAKPAGYIRHGGGERLDGEEARLFERWIAEGARRLERRTLASLEIEPARVVVDAPGETVRLEALARFTDGTTEDVTRRAVFTVDDPTVELAKERRGEIRPTRRGAATVLVRFLSAIVPVPVVVPATEHAVSLESEPRTGFIDDFILAGLESLHLEPAPPAGDATFVRRATLALAGRLPLPCEVEAFENDHGDEHGPDGELARRVRLVDRLLADPSFTDFWTFRLERLLHVRSLASDQETARSLHAWIRREVAGDFRFDRFARELLTATGDSHEVGPAGFSRMASGPREEAELVSEALLGAKLGCANCHDHPLDRWTQDDYHGLAAIFARLDRGQIVRLGNGGEVTHPRTGEPARPRIPGERFLALEPDEDPRIPLADWLVSPENPLFAKAMVNRLWAALFGRGLVEPVDDLRATNPASHPRLLEALAAELVREKYALRPTLRRIALSAAFARGGKYELEAPGVDRRPSAALEERFLARYPIRYLEAEVFADAIGAVTGVSEPIPGFPGGTRAIEIFDGAVSTRSLELLGRCSREGCSGSGAEPAGLALELHFLNGELLNRRITDPSGRLAREIELEKEPLEIVAEFYRLALARTSRSAEEAFWSAELGRATNPQSAREILEDFLWSLLRSEEFRTMR